jgi:hypothetical protein
MIQNDHSGDAQGGSCGGMNRLHYRAVKGTDRSLTKVTAALRRDETDRLSPKANLERFVTALTLPDGPVLLRLAIERHFGTQ